VPYDWLRTALAWIEARGIEPYEVTQILYGRHRLPRPVVDPLTGLRFIRITGRTRAGRLLTVTVRLGLDRAHVIVSAGEAAADEREEYERWERTR
jgi:hypothetical protein